MTADREAMAAATLVDHWLVTHCQPLTLTQRSVARLTDMIAKELAEREDAARREERDAITAILEARVLQLGEMLSAVEEGGRAHSACGAAAHELLQVLAAIRARGEP